MKSVLQFFAKRRFNYVDLVAFAVLSELWSAGYYWGAVLAFVAFMVISITVETKAGA
jgi:hypothetical protein